MISKCPIRQRIARFRLTINKRKKESYSPFSKALDARSRFQLTKELDVSTLVIAGAILGVFAGCHFDGENERMCLDLNIRCGSHCTAVSQPLPSHFSAVSQPCRSRVAAESQPLHGHVTATSWPHHGHLSAMSQPFP